MLDKNYGGFIWTNHALDRLRERGISQGDAFAALRSPDQSRYATTKGAWVYYKTWGNQRLEVVAKQNDHKQWVVMSVWSRPVYGNETKKVPLLELIFKKLWKKIKK